MELVELLEDARTAAPGRRIELRDPIAAYGVPAIEAVQPWLQDDRLAGFAVRVIERAGVDGERAAATTVLRAARTKVPENVRTDVDWALERLKTTRPEKPARTADAPAPTPRREPPRYDATAARRPR
jgi:hypothetical protein